MKISMSKLQSSKNGFLNWKKNFFSKILLIHQDFILFFLQILNLPYKSVKNWFFETFLKNYEKNKISFLFLIIKIEKKNLD